MPKAFHFIKESHEMHVGIFGNPYYSIAVSSDGFLEPIEAIAW